MKKKKSNNIIFSPEIFLKNDNTRCPQNDFISNINKNRDTSLINSSSNICKTFINENELYHKKLERSIHFEYLNECIINIYPDTTPNFLNFANSESKSKAYNEMNNPFNCFIDDIPVKSSRVHLDDFRNRINLENVLI